MYSAPSSSSSSSSSMSMASSTSPFIPYRWFHSVFLLLVSRLAGLPHFNENRFRRWFHALNAYRTRTEFFRQFFFHFAFSSAFWLRKSSMEYGIRCGPFWISILEFIRSSILNGQKVYFLNAKWKMMVLCVMRSNSFSAVWFVHFVLFFVYFFRSGKCYLHEIVTHPMPNKSFFVAVLTTI